MKVWDKLFQVEPETLRDHFAATILKSIQAFAGLFDAEDPFNVSFEELFGGVVFMIEGYKDTKMIPLENKPDFASYTPDGLFFEMIYITNNAGGNTYIIPIELALDLGLNKYATDTETR